MDSESFTKPGQLAVAGRSGATLALLVLCVAYANVPAYGQVTSQADPKDKPAATAQQTYLTNPPAAASPWGPDLIWSPLKPDLSIESDFFVNADIALVFPHLSSLLSAPVPLGEAGLTRGVALPNAQLNTTVSPVIQFGLYRLGPAYGELAFRYRFLAGDGRQSVAEFDSRGDLRSRLNLQTFDVDYRRTGLPLGASAVLGWEAGVRLQVVFFDTQLQSPALFEQARNYFFGAGPHAGFSIIQSLPYRLGLFGRFDGALIGGYNTTQNFVATVSGLDLLSGTLAQEQVDLSPMFGVQAGFTWSPDALPECRLRGGYQFEQWYNLGLVGASRGDLSVHGVFINCEFAF